MELLKLTSQTILEESVRIALKQKMKTWNELKHILHIHRLELFARDPVSEAAYTVHKKQVLQEWSSIDDYIIGKLFRHIPVSIGSDNKKFVTHLSPHIQRETGEVMLSLDESFLNSDKPATIVFVPNEFPYHLEPSISHDCLWSLEKLERNTIEEWIEKYKPQSQFDILWFENPPNLKSIKHVFHVHIFSKRKGDNKSE